MNKYVVLKIIIVTFVLGISTLNYFEKFEFHRVINFGWGVYSVTSDSMSPAIKKGDVIFSKSIDRFESIRTGDIVTFTYPMDVNRNITHRVVELSYENGYEQYISKGDANQVNDPWLLEEGDIRGKVVFSVPYLGYLLSFLRSPVGWLSLIVIPIGFIIFKEMDVLYKELRYFYESVLKRKIPKIKATSRRIDRLIGKSLAPERNPSSWSNS